MQGLLADSILSQVNYSGNCSSAAFGVGINHTLRLQLAGRRPGVREGEHFNPEVPPVKAGRAKQSIATNLLRRFREHAYAVLRFIGDLSVPFTNNETERAMRMPKIKQKISGCFRSRDGAGHFCVIRSCLDTLRKQCHGMLAVLQRAFAGDPIQPFA